MPEDGTKLGKSEKIAVAQFGFKTRELDGLPDGYRIANQHLSNSVLDVIAYGPLLIHARALQLEPAALDSFDAALPTLGKLPEKHRDGGILIIPMDWPSFPVIRTYPEYVYRVALFDGSWPNVLEHICPKQHHTAQVAEKAANEMEGIRRNPLKWGIVMQKISGLIEPEIQDHIKSCRICQVIFENAMKFAPAS